MSGHFAAARHRSCGTAGHDIYITDWKNARDVPLAEGRSDWMSSSIISSAGSG